MVRVLDAAPMTIVVLVTTLATAGSSCSSAKFSAIVSRQGGAPATAADPASCGFFRVPHPGLDAMVFDITVPGATAVIDMPGLRERRPVSAGQQYIFTAIPVPVGPDGRAVVRVNSGAASGSCETTVFPVSFQVSPLRFRDMTETSGVVEFDWTWSGLYAGELIRFDASRSGFSQDLKLDCAGAKPQASTNRPGRDQMFTCKATYKTTSQADSVRYKDHIFAWILALEDASAVGPDLNTISPTNQLFDRRLERTVSIDIAKSNPLDPAAAAAELRDPATCAVLKGKTGLAFSHVCDRDQSLFGGFSGGPAACVQVDPSACSN